MDDQSFFDETDSDLSFDTVESIADPNATMDPLNPISRIIGNATVWFVRFLASATGPRKVANPADNPFMKLYILLPDIIQSELEITPFGTPVLHPGDEGYEFWIAAMVNGGYLASDNPDLYDHNKTCPKPLFRPNIDDIGQCCESLFDELGRDKCIEPYPHDNRFTCGQVIVFFIQTRVLSHCMHPSNKVTDEPTYSRGACIERSWYSYQTTLTALFLYKAMAGFNSLPTQARPSLESLSRDPALSIFFAKYCRPLAKWCINACPPNKDLSVTVNDLIVKDLFSATKTLSAKAKKGLWSNRAIHAKIDEQNDPIDSVRLSASHVKGMFFPQALQYMTLYPQMHPKFRAGNNKIVLDEENTADFWEAAKESRVGSA